MMSAIDPVRQAWIVAGSRLAEDPTAQVPCPNCGPEFLSVTDVPYDADPSMVARYLRCETCGSVEIVDRVRVRKGAP